MCTPSSGPGGDGPSVSPMTEQREKMLACNQSVAVVSSLLFMMSSSSNHIHDGSVPVGLFRPFIH